MSTSSRGRGRSGGRASRGGGGSSTGGGSRGGGPSRGGRRGLAGTAAEGEASSWRAAELAAEIKELIARHAPEKLDGVPALLKKHAGHEEELLQKVKAKYSAK